MIELPLLGVVKAASAVLVKHRRSSGRQNMVDQGVIVRPERVYDR